MAVTHAHTVCLCIAHQNSSNFIWSGSPNKLDHQPSLGPILAWVAVFLFESISFGCFFSVNVLFVQVWKFISPWNPFSAQNLQHHRSVGECWRFPFVAILPKVSHLAFSSNQPTFNYKIKQKSEIVYRCMPVDSLVSCFVSFLFLISNLCSFVLCTAHRTRGQRAEKLHHLIYVEIIVKQQTYLSAIFLSYFASPFWTLAISLQIGNLWHSIVSFNLIPRTSWKNVAAFLYHFSLLFSFFKWKKITLVNCFSFSF